ncbi:addiction module antidote protein [Rugamonas rubra]|uniref:Probable addiction module antidote protein n=1 Tax=Rugamonas rubra TaxID=758825 RepID=A0A1I4TUL5_9BURK|nr:addiction module antidote protein [Rugamonas rubra]SFM80331.1 probable addiction module antidote protein [Rugamonas rubra]
METAENPVANDQFDIERIKALPKYEAADYLRTEEALVAFINEFLADSDATMFAEAILVACKAKGMTEVASKAGIARESLYKALRPQSQPRFDTILKVLHAIGLRLVVQPICAESSDRSLGNGTTS